MHPSLLSTGGAPVASLESRGGPGDGSGQEEGRGQDEVVGLGGDECGEPTRLEGVGRLSCKMGTTRLSMDEGRRRGFLIGVSMTPHHICTMRPSKSSREFHIHTITKAQNSDNHNSI